MPEVLVLADEDSLKAWMKAQPEGFLLNVDGDWKAPTVHRVSCASLRSATVAEGQHKVAAESAFALASWARSEHDVGLGICGRCSPL